MLYVLKPNPLYGIDKDKGVVYIPTMKVVFQPEEEVTLKLYDITVTHSFEWFYLMAKYHIYLPYQAYNRIGDIIFRSVGRSYISRQEHLVQTKEPIIITTELTGDKEYAFALDGNGLAITEYGEILDVDNNIIYKEINGYTTNDYSYYYINQTRVLVHRMVLEAWEWNPDPTVIYLANHLDGNKRNFRKDNLEWVSPSGNVNHAIRTGLTNYNLSCKIKHKSTGNILEFDSVVTMTKFLRTSPRPANEYKAMRLGATVDGYEIRVNGDDREWYYKTGIEETIPSGSVNKFTLFENGILLKRFYNYQDINAYFNFPKRTPIERILAIVPLRHKNMSINVETLTKTGPYEAKNYITNEIVEADSVSKISNRTGVNDTTILRAIRGTDLRIFQNWIFRVKSTDEWPVTPNTANSNTVKNKVNVTYANGNVEVYESIAETAIKLKLNRKTIRRYLNNGFDYLGMRFSLTP